VTRVALVALIVLVPMAGLADVKAGAKKAQLCLLCHKLENTRLALSTIPLLEGQPAAYLYAQTRACKEKRRNEPSMQTNVANLSDRDMRDIAAYLAVQKPLRAAHPVDTDKVAAGKAAAEALKCGECHGAAGKRDLPRLAGQTAGYTVAQLELFAAAKRPHGSAPLLAVTAQEMESLAHYFAQQE